MDVRLFLFGLILLLSIEVIHAKAQDKAPVTGAGNKPLPTFAQKVQLHNLDGAEATEDGQGIRLHRVPKSLRDQLTEKNSGSGKTGAEAMSQARHSEIRFVLNEGEKPENVKIHLQSPGDVLISFFWGDVFCGDMRYRYNAAKPQPIAVQGHGLLYNLMDKFPAGRFPNRLCRIVISGADVTFTGIDGDVRPPKPSELPPVMLTYGTSITQGHAASRADLAWNALTARNLGYDLINLGSGGTAYCESAMADYIAQQKWDLCTLELSVNMVNPFTVDEFRKRVTYLIDTVAKSHPNSPVVCISIFPWGVGDYWTGNDAQKKTQEFRKVLEEVCKASPHKNVHFIAGPELLSFTGLSSDMLHPSDHGMYEIATKLTPRINELLKH